MHFSPPPPAYVFEQFHSQTTLSSHRPIRVSLELRVILVETKLRYVSRSHLSMIMSISVTVYGCM